MTSRLIYLDNLRSFALLLGLVFHSAIVYADSIGYALKSDERSVILDHFCFFVHSFRMPLFFFLSGFFSEMVWHKKTWKFYLSTRSNRLFIPLIIGLLIFAPIQYYIMQLGKKDNLGFTEFYFHFFTDQYFGLSHLWFLYYLIVYCIILPFLPGKESFFKFKVHSTSLFLFLFFSITLGISLIAHSFFPKGYKFLEIDPYFFFYNFSFFFAGILAYQNQAIFQETEIRLRRKILLFVFAFFLLAFFENSEKTDPLWMGYFFGREWIRFFHLTLASMTAWGFIYFFIEFFKRFFRKETSMSLYLRDSSLPIYLIHHPVSLILGYGLYHVEVGVYIKFSIHVTLVFLISYGIYDSFVKPSPIWRRLLGMKV